MLSAIRPERGPDARPHSARDRRATRTAGDVPAQAPPLVADQVRHQRVLPQCRERPLESPSPPPDRRSSSADRHCDDRDRLHDRRQFRPDPMGDNRRLRSVHRRFRAVAAAAIAAAGEALARKADGPQWPRRRRAAPLVVAAAEPAITHPLAPSSHRFAVLPALAVFSAILLASCGGSDNATPAPTATQFPATSTPAPSTVTPTPGLGSPQFESARALQHDHALSVDIGIRAAGTDGEKRAANYIRDELAKYGYDASLQPFPIQTFVDVKTALDLLSPQQRPVDAGATTVRLTVDTRTETRDSHNVVAKPPGKQCRLVVGGHYDSVPAGPGANDNASGTATAIEMARAMAADGTLDPVCFVLF